MLTEKGISQAKPKDKLYRLSDNTGNNLSLEVSPEGGKRWRFRYRFQGKAKMISLGTYPLVSLKDARSRAIDAKKELDSGVDPGSKKKAAQGIKNFQEVAKEWFDLFSAEHSPRYSAEVWSRLEREVFPFIGNKLLADIDAPAVLSILRWTEGRDVIVTMYKIKSHISQIFKYAIASGLAYADPSRDLSAALRSKPSKPMSSIIEPKEVGKLMFAITGYSRPVVRSALLLGILTFVRPGELRTAEWEEFDMEAAEWRIPAAKMKMKRIHIVPLAEQAIAILRQIQPVTGQGKYVFPSVRSRDRAMSENTVTAALRRMGFTREEMTAHGFRGMASTLLHENGFKSDVIEAQLAHAQRNKVKAAYNHAEYLLERAEMMNWWADYLDELRSSKP